jgi:hypothetical protein
LYVLQIDSIRQKFGGRGQNFSANDDQPSSSERLVADYTPIAISYDSSNANIHVINVEQNQVVTFVSS